MSRIGKLSIEIPQGVSVTVAGHVVKVQGPKGKLERTLPSVLETKVDKGRLFVEARSQSKEAGVLHGTFRSHLANMIKGVSTGWTRQLELVGSGYRAEVRGEDIILTVGFSNPVVINLPEGIMAKVEKSIISIEGADKEVVGNLCASIRRVRPPEPYKGKGILYLGEVVRRKAGKAATAAATG